MSEAEKTGRTRVVQSNADFGIEPTGRKVLVMDHSATRRASDHSSHDRHNAKAKKKQQKQDRKRSDRKRSLQLRKSRRTKLALRGEVCHPRNFKPTKHRRPRRIRSSKNPRSRQEHSRKRLLPVLHPSTITHDSDWCVSNYKRFFVQHYQAAEVEECREFNDSLLRLSNTKRLNDDLQEREYAKDLQDLMKEGCRDDVTRWKLFVLTLLHTRYHLLSPEAKQQQTLLIANSNKKAAKVVAGKGERKLFYQAIKVLCTETMQQDKAESTSLAIRHKLTSLQTLVALAPYAGGSRDVAALIEEMVSVTLMSNYARTIGARKEIMLAPVGKESLTPLVTCGVQIVSEKMTQDDSNSPFAVLQGLLEFAAETLDQDLDLIEKHNTNGNAMISELPSTLHVFLPHRDRGRSGNKRRKDVPWRQIVNCVAEILIWSRTRHAKGNQVFVRHYREAFGATTIVGQEAWTGIRVVEQVSKDDDAKIPLHALQTIIRKEWRCELNKFARDKGFMLSNQYVLKGPSALTMKMVNVAKACDLSRLQTMATKKTEDAEAVLRLIQLRSQDPAKVNKYSSIAEMKHHAVSAPKADGKGMDEVTRLGREIHVARVKATLSYLRSLAEPTVDKERKAIIASLDSIMPNHAAAVLTAAALGTWELGETSSTQASPDSSSQQIHTLVKLLLGGTDSTLTSFDDFLETLDKVLFGKLDVDEAPSFMTLEGNATTKAVLNLLDRHVTEDNVTLMLVGSQDIELPRNVLEDLAKRHCRIHCHDADDIGERLLREKAKKGDVTISLAWDTEDDLDLHVFVPGGEEILFSNRTSEDGLCHLDVDMNAGYPYSSEPVENVFCGDLEKGQQAPTGTYEVVVWNYAFNTRGKSGRKVPFRLVVEKDGTKQKYVCETSGGEGEKSKVTVCKFLYNGRTMPFPSDEDTSLSAFGTSNLLNVTSSSGQTLEALSQFAQAIQQHETLEEAKEWLAEDEEADQAVVTRLTASEGEVAVTNYDRLQILLAKLPTRFHMAVDEAFSGAKLSDHCARSLARQMVRDRVPLSELSKMGWPEEIASAVREQLHRALAL